MLSSHNYLIVFKYGQWNRSYQNIAIGGNFIQNCTDYLFHRTCCIQHLVRRCWNQTCIMSGLYVNVKWIVRFNAAFRPTTSCKKASDTVTYLEENGQTGQDSCSSQLIIVVRTLRSGAFNTLTKSCSEINFFLTILSPKRIVLSGRSFCAASASTFLQGGQWF